jgi:CheY-like chemotaxis protein
VMEALAHAESSHFDLVISDANLPDGDGRDLMLQLHTRFGLDGIAITGHGTPQDIARSRKSGFASHLTKPVTVRDLDQAMDSYFVGRGPGGRV